MKESDFHDAVGGVQVKQSNYPLVACKIRWPLRHDEASDIPQNLVRQANCATPFSTRLIRNSPRPSCRQNAD